MKKGIVAVFLIVFIAVVINVFNKEGKYLTAEAVDSSIYLSKMARDIAKTTNEGGLFVRLNGAENKGKGEPYLADDLVVMMPISDVRDLLELDIKENSDKEIMITQGISRIFLTVGDSNNRVNGQTVDMGSVTKE